MQSIHKKKTRYLLNESTLESNETNNRFFFIVFLKHAETRSWNLSCLSYKEFKIVVDPGIAIKPDCCLLWKRLEWLEPFMETVFYLRSWEALHAVNSCLGSKNCVTSAAFHAKIIHEWVLYIPPWAVPASHIPFTGMITSKISSSFNIDMPRLAFLEKYRLDERGFFTMEVGFRYIIKKDSHRMKRCSR